MRIRDYELPDVCQRRTQVEYYRPNGERRVIATQVGMDDLENDPRYQQQQMLHVKNQIIRDVSEQVNKQMATVSPNYIWYDDSSQVYTNTVTNTSIGSEWITYDNVRNAYNNIYGQVPQSRTIKLKFKVGKRMLEVSKSLDGDSMELSESDIEEAKVEYIRQAKVQIITRKSEERSETLLRSFVSELDFRSYKQNGFFTVRKGNQLFRIYKDRNAKIDCWERNDRGLFMPKSRLCVGTSRKELPSGDEALARLLLVRSGGVEKLANRWAADGLEAIEEKELVIA